MMGGTRMRGDGGYAMAALLVAMSIMAVAMSMLLPAWRTMAQREREAEYFFRGQQYATAIARYQRARGAFPPDIDVLVRERFLRKKYKDPLTGEDFEVVRVGQALPGQVPAGQQQQQQQQQPQRPQSSFQARIGGAGGGPVIGVVSKSTGTSFRVVNGRNKYNEIPFVPTEATQQAGGGGRGTQRPGVEGGTQRPGAPQGGGARPGMTPLGPGRGGQRLQLPGGRANPRGNPPL